jgi:Protein of unknown function (DUF3800)
MSEGNLGYVSEPELPIVYADESNNSGENLTDSHQPVFAASAVLMDATNAAAIVQSVRAQLPAGYGEAKYSSLSKSGTGRRVLLDVLARLPDGAARTYVAHKRFMIVAKIVDYLVVELAHGSGYDMYADGSALGLANLLYYAGPVLGDPAEFDRMLQTFVDALRPTKSTTIDDLFIAIEAYRQTAQDGLRDKIMLVEAAREHADEIDRLISHAGMRDALDPAVPCLAELCYDMGTRIGRFRLVHDQSNTIARNALTLLTVDALPQITPVLKLPPLPAVEITFADSAAAPQLQLADWIAGATRQVADARFTGTQNPFVDQLAPLVDGWLSGGIWPDIDTISTPRPPVSPPPVP